MPSSDPALLFVYGTLRRGCMTPMADWLASAAQWHGPAQARGWLYRVDGYPGFVSDDEGRTIQGDLFQLPDSVAREAIFARLDAYEECAPHNPLPHEYARIVLPVLSAGVVLSAWTYVYRYPTAHLPLIESGDFLRDGPFSPR